MVFLVTGGTGFLGSYFTRYLVHEQRMDRVVVLESNVDRGGIEDVLDHVVLVEGDVTDAATVRSVLEGHGVTHVAHFAFMLGSPAPGKMIPYTNVQCMGTATVFEEARLAGVQRVLFCSSIAAYGDQKVAPLSEALVPNPSELYGSAKLWGESLARYYTNRLGLEVVTLRFGSTYGLGRATRGSFRSGLLNQPAQTHYMAKVEDAVRGIPVVLPRGDALADWTYASDNAQAVWLALTTPTLPHRLFNVCSEYRPVADFTRTFAALLPDADITTSDTESPDHPYPPMDNSLLVNELGFSPRYSLQAGLEDYVSRIRAYDRYVATATN